MNVTLYGFLKRENSTMIPSFSGATREIVLKDETSVLYPTLVLNYGNANPSQYNYCYLDRWSRYYFIRDWVYNGRMWEAICEPDPMGTWRADILRTGTYVLRSASDYNANIIDTLYPVEAGNYDIQTLATSFDFPTDPNGGGCYVVGLVGANGSGGTYVSSGVNYYYLTPLELQELVNYMFTNGPGGSAAGQVPDNWSSLPDKILEVPAKMFINPMDFIKFGAWYPFSIPGGGDRQNLWFAWWDSGHSGRIVDSHIYNFYYTVNIPKKSGTLRGKWEMLEPFAKYYIRVPGFGQIGLQAAELLDATSITCSFNVDVYTTAATLKLFTNQGYFLGMYNGTFGIPIAFGSAKQDIGATFQAVTGALAGGAELIGGALGGSVSSILGGAGQLVNAGISSLQAAFKPVIGSVGNAGGISDLDPTILCTAAFMQPAPEDRQHRGRPLCEYRVLNNLSGFCQVADGNIATRATPSEKATIKKYLESGFYIE